MLRFYKIYTNNTSFDFTGNQQYCASLAMAKLLQRQQAVTDNAAAVWKWREANQSFRLWLMMIVSLMKKTNKPKNETLVYATPLNKKKKYKLLQWKARWMCAPFEIVELR